MTGRDYNRVFKVVFFVNTLKFVLAAVWLSAGISNGQVVIYQFHPLIIGAFPGAQTPQIEATFRDVNPGKVLLTVTSSGLAGGEFLGDLYFNFDPADNVNRLYFTRLNNPFAPSHSRISTGQNSFPAGGYGCYDIHLNFGTAGRPNPSGNASVTYQITGPGLDASDFAFVDACGSSPGLYYALARVQQNICGSSEWLGCSSLQSVQPVPEPASFTLFVFAAGMSGCIYLRTKRPKPTRSRG